MYQSVTFKLSWSGGNLISKEILQETPIQKADLSCASGDKAGGRSRATCWPYSSLRSVPWHLPNARLGCEDRRSGGSWPGWLSHGCNHHVLRVLAAGTKSPPSGQEQFFIMKNEQFSLWTIFHFPNCWEPHLQQTLRPARERAGESRQVGFRPEAGCGSAFRRLWAVWVDQQSQADTDQGYWDIREGTVKRKIRPASGELE